MEPMTFQESDCVFTAFDQRSISNNHSASLKEKELRKGVAMPSNATLLFDASTSQREAPASDIISAMTVGITGPRRRAPWRGAVMVLIIAGIVLPICLILLGLTGDFLVDWLWFSTIGYLGVFWTTIAAEAEVFSAVFVATAIILWVNGSIASRFGRSPWTYRAADFEWKRTGIATLPDVREFMRHRLPWPFVTASGASVLAVLVAWGEVHNWGVFLRFLYHVPYGANDPLYGKDIGFYLFALPAFVVIKNWMLLTLLLSALFAGAIY